MTICRTGGIERALIGRFLGWEDSDHARDFSFAAASDLLWELARVRIDTKQVERCAEALGRQVATDERDRVAPAPAAAPTMYLGLDGTGVPVRKSEVEGRRGKQPDVSAKTREVKLVTWEQRATA